MASLPFQCERGGWCGGCRVIQTGSRGEGAFRVGTGYLVPLDVDGARLLVREETPPGRVSPALAGQVTTVCVPQSGRSGARPTPQRNSRPSFLWPAQFFVASPGPGKSALQKSAVALFLARISSHLREHTLVGRARCRSSSYRTRRGRPQVCRTGRSRALHRLALRWTATATSAVSRQSWFVRVHRARTPAR